MDITLDTKSLEDYRRFLAIKKLPAYSFRGHQATFPDEYATLVDGATVTPAAQRTPSFNNRLFDYQRDIWKGSNVHELALFAGAGGGILGGRLLGWRTICAVELDTYAASVLVARQNDGHLPPFPVWDDVRTFDGRTWRGRVDVISGGFPCQDISAAGKGAGIDGERSGLWREFARIIGEVRPRYVFVENSPVLTSRGLGRVLGDLAALGFDAEWGVVSASDAIWIAGDPCLCHERERIWIVARADSNSSRQVPRLSQSTRRKPKGKPTGVRSPRPNANGDGWPQVELQDREAAQTTGVECSSLQSRSRGRYSDWWKSEPDLGRVADGMAHQVDRIRAVGNGQVPAVAALAWRILYRRLTGSDYRAEGKAHEG